MEIRIGIVNAPRELSFESSQSAEELTDDKGRLYVVPTAGIAYIEIGTEESRRIGFVG